MTKIRTIGYEHATQPAMLDELARSDVALVVDVRAVAASRRPGFSKTQLAAALGEHGIAYLHLRGLGTPKEGRLAARAGRAKDMLRIYDRHLNTPQARDEFDQLAALAKSGRALCLLCYERDPARCHRTLLAKRLEERLGIGAENLFCTPV
jgi:uncharacterized protein (DUF488 family)